MTIKKTVYENVKRDGTLEGRDGAIVTEGIIRMSNGINGCGLEKCHCSDGHWIMIGTGRDSYGRVEVLLATFDDAKEMQDFFKFHETISYNEVLLDQNR